MLMQVLWIALVMAWTPLTAWQQLDNSFSQFGDRLELFGLSMVVVLALAKGTQPSGLLCFLQWSFRCI